ncbi:efflux RND transporter periplasmic adaptor subunit [Massilia arenosa]|uniref:Efflux RND transporter periplasmic adaptor subunit n=1 Tax=Zemynaea arenosa TaxID=2561931 RepID=A0A4Y9S1B1_9BURK|nr:efflux RND transporter periplasmic adaptor subunit [Massilia arenosa]TFW13338.1 efflux RND transporter periplasmic adaptor subunit [Massilia arenosa]
MNTRIAVLCAGTLLMAAALGYGGYRLGQQSAVKQTSVPAAASGRRILYWQDPMVPGQRFDKPGKSPYMDMDLVPVYADEQVAGSGVAISPGVQQSLGVRLAEVREAAVGASAQWVGNVAYDERDRVLVTARSNGFIERLHVRAALEPVRKGQPLFDLYVPEWVAAQEDYLAIKRMAAPEPGLLDAALQRMRLAGMTDDQVRQVAGSARVLRRVTVTAPAAGIVTELVARDGMTVATGAPLVTINGLRRVWVNAEVPETAAASVRPGSAVQVTAPAYPGKTFAGRVEALLPQVSAATRTLVARVTVANEAGELTPGMFANVSAQALQAGHMLVVPSEAVIRTGQRDVVIVAQEQGRFLPTEVLVGREANGETEIRKGLSAGQRVVASGQFLIDSEASLRGALRRMEPASPPAKEGKPSGERQSAEATHRASGRIDKVGPDEITISHGPVPSMKWPAMTMGFLPPAGGLPAGVAVGANVDFTFRQGAGHRYEITSIRVQTAAPAGTPPRPASATPAPAPLQTPTSPPAPHDHSAHPGASR